MTNGDNRFAKIKSEIQRLQLYVLIKFFECAMYQALGESWKEKVVSKAMFKTITGNYKDNYIKIIDSIKRKKDFDVEDLDITALVTLIRYDFLSECCTYKRLKATDLSFIIKKIKDDRNSLAHSSINSDDYIVCSNAIENLEKFQLYLEENNWVYEEIPNSTKYFQNKQMEEKFSLKYIGQEISNCKGILESLSMLSVINNNKKVTIEFVDSYGQAVENISCLIESKIYLSKLSYSYEKIKKIDVSLLLGEYMIICIAVPEDYEKFETEILNIKVSDSYNISKKIILHKKKIFEDTIESERFVEPLSHNENVGLLQTNAMVKNEKVRVNICLLDEEKNFVKKCKMQILNKNNKVLKNWISTNRPFVYDFYYGNYRIEILETPPMFIKPTIQLLEISELQLNEKELNYEIILYKIKKKELFISIVDEKKDFVSGLEIQVFNESNDNKAFFSCITDAKPIKFLLRPGKYIIKIINSDFEIENSVLVFNVLDDSSESRLEWMIYKKIVNDTYLNLKNINNARYNKKVSALITDNEDKLKKYDITDAKNLNLEAKNSNIENFDSEKLFEKGCDYYYGNGVEVDYLKAYKFFKKATEKGNVKAIFELGEMYFYGNGVSINHEKAFYYFFKAAELNLPEAQFELSKCYENGDGVEKNYEMGIKWLKCSAEGNFVTAQEILAIHYDDGLYMDKDKKEALKWYMRAAEKGSAFSQYIVGFKYQIGEGVYKDEKQAVRWYMKAANNNHVDAQYNLALCYDNGIGINKDKKIAIYWYIKSAEQGCIEAQNKLGIYYFNGEEVEKDLSIAFDYFKKAAEKGNAESEFYMGTFYFKGLYVNQDKMKAIEWYQKAADHGDSRAESVMAFLYYEGQLVKRNYTKSYNLFLHAAKQKNITAIRNLGVFYEKGIYVDKNYNEAEKYYKEAIKYGDESAKEYLKNLYLRIKEEKISVDTNLIKEYEEKARNGDIEAQYKLGSCYENGEGVDKDFIKAADWYRKAAKQNHKQARISLVKLLNEYPSLGNGFEPICLIDYLSDWKLRETPLYQYKIGLCYEHGLDCEKNIEEAFYWYKKSAEQEYELAKEACIRLEEDYPQIVKKKGFLKKIFG